MHQHELQFMEHSKCCTSSPGDKNVEEWMYGSIERTLRSASRWRNLEQARVQGTEGVAALKTEHVTYVGSLLIVTLKDRLQNEIINRLQNCKHS